MEIRIYRLYTARVERLAVVIKFETRDGLLMEGFKGV
jgi:hypothetical protein